MDISLCLVSVFIVFLLKIIFDNSRYVCDRGETKCQKRAAAKKKVVVLVGTGGSLNIVFFPIF